MLLRLRDVCLVLLVFVCGFAAGNGPYADWASDLANMLRMAWGVHRAAGGPGGAGPLLLSGFLLGQGLYLVGRVAAARVGPARARRLDRLAEWDSVMHVGSRFGLQRYLNQCARWASDDPTARTQCLAIFKVQHLAKLNELRGSAAATEFLRRVAAEVRAAALPETVSSFRRWLWHYFPRPIAVSSWRIPPARYPARWSGSAFAVAFRELDALQVVLISRNVGEWLRRELDALKVGESVTSTVAVIVGSAGADGAQITSMAETCFSASSNEGVRVLIDSRDSRSEAICQLQGIEAVRLDLNIARESSDIESHGYVEAEPSPLRLWGPGAACIVGAAILIGATSGKQPVTTTYPWPESLKELQLIEAAGPRAVRLVRTPLHDQVSPNWRVSNALLVQGNPEDGSYGPFQLHLTITNLSSNTYYVSPFDFTATDSANHEIPLDPIRTLKIENGLAGHWIEPGSSWSGWLVGTRSSSRIVSFGFHPDRATRIVSAEANAAR